MCKRNSPHKMKPAQIERERERETERETERERERIQLRMCKTNSPQK